MPSPLKVLQSNEPHASRRVPGVVDGHESLPVGEINVSRYPHGVPFRLAWVWQCFPGDIVQLVRVHRGDNLVSHLQAQ